MRICQCGFETGHASAWDASNTTVNSATTRGTWSGYSGRNGTSSWDASVSEFYAAFGYLSNNSGNLAVCEFKSPNGNINIDIRQDATAGKFQLRRNGTVLGTGTTTYATGVWYFMEFHLVIHDTTGVYEMRINGQTEIAAATSQDTRADAGANGDKCDRLLIGGDSNQFFDDIMVNDTTGSFNTSWVGDQRISVYIPNAAGDSTGLTRGGTDSGSNYGQVDERPPNDVTDYVYGTDTTSKDLYNIPNTSGVSDVSGVKLYLRAQKSDAGSGNIAHLIKSGSTEDVGSDVGLSTSWAAYAKLYDHDPTDSAVWSASKINALQIGAKSR